MQTSSQQQIKINKQIRIDKQEKLDKMKMPRMIRVNQEVYDSLRLRVRFLRYEAHVDLLEVMSFFATINLAALCMTDTASGLPKHYFGFMFGFAPSYVWTLVLVSLAVGELWASLFNKLWARCWIQFASACVFSLYVVLLMSRGTWLISPRDYIIFTIAAGFSFVRLRSEMSKVPRRKINRLAFFKSHE